MTATNTITPEFHHAGLEFPRIIIGPRHQWKYVFLDALPKIATNKILRRVLRETATMVKEEKASDLVFHKIGKGKQQFPLRLARIADRVSLATQLSVAFKETSCGDTGEQLIADAKDYCLPIWLVVEKFKSLQNNINLVK